MHQKSTFTSQSQVIRLECQLNFCRLIVVYSKRKTEANWCSPKRNCSLYRRPTLMKSSLLNIAQCLVGTGATTVTAVVPVIVAELPMTGRMKLYSHPPRPHLQLLHNHTPQTGRGVISDQLTNYLTKVNKTYVVNATETQCCCFALSHMV